MLKTTPDKLHLRAIRRAGVPLAAFESADAAQTVKSCIDALNGKAKPKDGEDAVPLITWCDPLTHPLPDILKLFADNVPAKGVVFL